LPKNVAWIDLLKPEPDEVAFVKRTTGLEVPSIEALSEIESSSRLRSQNGAIYLSAPLIYRADSNQPLTTPVGGTAAAARRRRSRLVRLLCRNGRRPETSQCRHDKPYPAHGCASMCCLS